MAAAYDIQKHFSGLRVQTARRRRDPFATGFEDDSEDEGRTSRTKTKAPAVVKPKPPPVAPPKTSISSPFAAIDALRDSDDDFLDVPVKKRTARRPSPAPARLAATRLALNGTARRGSLPGFLPSTNPKKAVELAAGPLAYLDDSSDDEPPLRTRHTDRNYSPAPAYRKGSPFADGTGRSQTPRGDRSLAREQAAKQSAVLPPKHTVASPFAGTKYLQDSDSDEAVVSSRKNSAESIPSADPPEKKADGEQKQNGDRLAVKRVDKSKQNGSGVSWRAFSASRAEQRFAEVEALQASLQQRGRSISFCPTVTTDDGRRIPLSPTSERGPGPLGAARAGRKSKSKSPPRRVKDTEPEDEEMADRQPVGGPVGLYDPVKFKTNPFTGEPVARSNSNPSPDGDDKQLGKAADSIPDIRINISPNDILQSPQSLGSMADSIESIAQKLNVSPQTIPETSTIHHALPSPMMSPVASFVDDPLSRHSSTRSMGVPRSQRGPPTRRSSRRSESGLPSSSPAHAFLSSWGKAEEPPPEPKPDDEGQSVGLNNEYVIGRTINRGGFGVIKEVHAIDESGRRTMRAVKIVRKAIQGVSETLNEKAQQECEHEVSIWRYLKHRHVLMLHAVYETDFATFCVMDLNVGGTLFDLVRKTRTDAAKDSGRRGLAPHLARTYAFQLAAALRYLHEDIRVCHRDVKLENCLLDMSTPDADEKGGNLRLCDFGLADFLHSSSIDDGEPATDHFGEHLSLSTELPVQTASSIIGTLEYASPKGLTVNRKLFETAGDVWAFGVVVYALCTGNLPFKHPMPSKTAELILRADWDEVALRDAAAGGPDVIDLVKGCFEKDLDIRFTISDALRSPWFAGCQEELNEGPTFGGWK